MKPGNELILAWKEYLHTHQEGRAAHVKADAMFEFALTKTGLDAELHNRATALSKHANRLHRHALAMFKAALKKAYDKRYRIEWNGHSTCTVWVHERYQTDETPLHFNKSLRCRKHLT